MVARLRFLLPTLLLTLVMTPGARAQAPAPAPVSAERLDQARRHMDEGQSLYARGRYAEAAQAFRQAYAVQPFAAFLFNEAVCHEKAGDPEQALATFRRYLTADPNPPDAEALKARIKRLEEAIARGGSAGAAPAPAAEGRNDAMHSLLVFESNPPGAPAQLWHRAEPTAGPFDPNGQNPGWKLATSGPTPLVATLVPGHYHAVVERWRSYNRSDDEIDVATGRVVQYRAGLSQGDFMGFLRVDTDVDRAQIYLDDPPPHAKKPWGTQAHGELVARGEHQVWVEAPGYDTYTETFRIETGQQKVITPNLARSTEGFLMVEGNASTIKLWLDGVEVGVYHPDDGPVQIKASKGTHRLRAAAEGKKDYSGEVEVAGGQTREVRLLLSSRHGHGAAWVGVVGSAATLGAGIYLGLKSRSLRDELRDDRRSGSLASDDPRIGDGRTYAILADVGFGLSAALGGFALFEFLRDPSPPSSAGFSAPRDLPDRRRSSRPAMRLVPAVTASQGGLVWQGAF